MVWVSRDVTVIVKLFAESGEFDSKLTAVLEQRTFFQGQTQTRERTTGLNGRHFDGCIPLVQKTLQLVDCASSRIQDPQNPSSM